MWEMIQRRSGKRNLRVHRFAILDQIRDACKIERMIFGAPSGLGDGPQTLDSAARELTDAAGFQPLIAEEWKRVPQALRKRRQRRIGVGGS